MTERCVCLLIDSIRHKGQAERQRAAWGSLWQTPFEGCEISDYSNRGTDTTVCTVVFLKY